MDCLANKAILVLVLLTGCANCSPKIEYMGGYVRSEGLDPHRIMPGFSCDI